MWNFQAQDFPKTSDKRRVPLASIAVLEAQDRPRQPALRLLIGAAPAPETSKLAALLQDWGYGVDLAASGDALREALNQADAAPILLLDPALPGLNGVALLDHLHSRSARRRIWTIALTDAPGPPSDRNQAAIPAVSPRNPGIDDVLARPIDEFELRVCLHAALRVHILHAEMIEAIDAARFHATHDSLTGLWNRESLLTRIFQETDRTQRLGSPLALLVLDLDRFSRVNRDHGYDGGDNVLRQLASRFRRHLRSYDLAGRCGEDEFLIAMPGGSPEDARAMATRLRECIAERPFDILKASVQLTASLGIAQSQGRSPLVVLREAQFALANVKLAGGDGIRFFADTGSASLPGRRSSPSPQSETQRSVHA
jgi:two-component system, cell cycle response regulator